MGAGALSSPVLRQLQAMREAEAVNIFVENGVNQRDAEKVTARVRSLSPARAWSWAGWIYTALPLRGRWPPRWRCPWRARRLSTDDRSANSESLKERNPAREAANGKDVRCGVTCAANCRRILIPTTKIHLSFERHGKCSGSFG